MVIKGDNYLTPSVPLSLKGEGEGNKKERRSLSWNLRRGRLKG